MVHLLHTGNFAAKSACCCVTKLNARNNAKNRITRLLAHTLSNFLLIVHDVQSEMKIKHSVMHNAENHVATRMCAHV